MAGIFEEVEVATRFSLAYLTVQGCAPPEMTHIAADAGYDFVSFRPIYMGLPNEPNYAFAEDKALFRETKRALAETGLALSDIELAKIQDGLDPKSYLPAFEAAAELGCAHVISSIWTQDRAFAIDCFGQLCDFGRPLGLSIELEFVTFAEVKTIAAALEIVNAAGRDNCGILVDTLHFQRSRVAPEELDAVPQRLFHIAHLCDAPAEIPLTKEGLIHTARDERLYVGEGGIDIAGILGRIPEVTYSIELPHVARVKEYGNAEHARLCLKTAKAYLADRAAPALTGAPRDTGGLAAGPGDGAKRGQ
ncbi:MAG: sugar phosphate isomerase/epimerase, partial [Treponema sp.]|nr:sugar phosphate isomerase/epimerase [Treponema sp.]